MWVCADTVPVLLEDTRCPIAPPYSSETGSLTELELGCFCSSQFSAQCWGESWACLCLAFVQVRMALPFEPSRQGNHTKEYGKMSCLLLAQVMNLLNPFDHWKQSKTSPVYRMARGCSKYPLWMKVGMLGSVRAKHGWLGGPGEDRFSGRSRTARITKRNPALNSNKRVGFVCFWDSLMLAHAGKLCSQSDSISDLPASVMWIQVCM